LHTELNYVQIKGTVIHLELTGENRKQRLTATFADGTGSIKLVWFQGIKWLANRIKANSEYVIFGKPTEFNGKLNFTHPEIEEVSKYKEKLDFKWQAFYNTTEKMKSKYLNSKGIHHIIKR
jgi:ATP-dependent DNA helicase RecG